VGKKVQHGLQLANQLNAEYAIVIGEKSCLAKVVKLKHMATRESTDCALNENSPLHYKLYLMRNLMFDYRRTHTCGELNRSHPQTKRHISGWVHRPTDHGGLIFIDLRDRFGLTQLIFDPAVVSKEMFEQASHLRSEWSFPLKE